jgi:hypothetical protein
VVRVLAHYLANLRKDPIVVLRGSLRGSGFGYTRHGGRLSFMSPLILLSRTDGIAYRLERPPLGGRARTLKEVQRKIEDNHELESSG